jgi:hypothetical protein
MYLEDYNGDVEKAEIIKSLRKPGNSKNPRKPLKVKVTNLNDNSVEYFDSRKELAKKLNMSDSALMARMYINNGKVNNLLIEYIKAA